MEAASKSRSRSRGAQQGAASSAGASAARMVGPSVWMAGSMVSPETWQASQAAGSSDHQSRQAAGYRRHPWCCLGEACIGYRCSDFQLVRMITREESRAMDGSEKISYGPLYCTQCWWDLYELQPNVEGILDMVRNFGYDEWQQSLDEHAADGIDVDVQAMVDQERHPLAGYDEGPIEDRLIEPQPDGHDQEQQIDGNDEEQQQHSYEQQPDGHDEELQIDGHDEEQQQHSYEQQAIGYDTNYDARRICTMGDGCVGSRTDKLVRHFLEGELKDVYCVSCWVSLARRQGGHRLLGMPVRMVFQRDTDP